MSAATDWLFKGYDEDSAIVMAKKVYPYFIIMQFIILFSLGVTEYIVLLKLVLRGFAALKIHSGHMMSLNKTEPQIFFPFCVLFFQELPF